MTALRMPTSWRTKAAREVAPCAATGSRLEVVMRMGLRARYLLYAEGPACRERGRAQNVLHRELPGRFVSCAAGAGELLQELQEVPMETRFEACLDNDVCVAVGIAPCDMDMHVATAADLVRGFADRRLCRVFGPSGERARCPHRLHERGPCGHAGELAHEQRKLAARARTRAWRATRGTRRRSTLGLPWAWKQAREELAGGYRVDSRGWRRGLGSGVGVSADDCGVETQVRRAGSLHDDMESESMDMQGCEAASGAWWSGTWSGGGLEFHSFPAKWFPAARDVPRR